MKKAFSLAEMMIMLLVLSLAMAASAPIISKASVKKVPPGSIVLWYGPTSKIPHGWHLCDGTQDTIDLRSRFILGAGNDNDTKTISSGWNTVNGHWMAGSFGGEEVNSYVKYSSFSNTSTTDTRAATPKTIILPRFYTMAYIERLPAKSLALNPITYPGTVSTTIASNPPPSPPTPPPTTCTGPTGTWHDMNICFLGFGGSIDERPSRGVVFETAQAASYALNTCFKFEKICKDCDGKPVACGGPKVLTGSSRTD